MEYTIVPVFPPAEYRSAFGSMRLTLEGGPLSVVIDDRAMVRNASMEIAALLRQRAERGLDKDGAPLPALSPGTIRRRREAGVADTTTPMHATGAYARSITAGPGGVTAQASKSAVDKYGADRLVGVPAGAPLEQVMRAGVQFRRAGQPVGGSSSAGMYALARQIAR